MKDAFTLAAVEQHFEATMYDEMIEESTSSVRAGFDPAEHARKLLNHETFMKNHMSYGIKSAQKRHGKGTFDSAKNQTMGANLSKLGDSKLGTKLNAAEHRAVGAHLAKHIEAKLNEEVELDEGADRARKGTSEFAKGQSPNKGKSVLGNLGKETDPLRMRQRIKLGHGSETLQNVITGEHGKKPIHSTGLDEGYDDTLDGDDVGFKMTAAEKALGKKRQATNARNSLLANVTRKVSRSNYTHDSSSDDESHAVDTNRKITAGADHPWIPKPVAPKTAAAKTVTRGVTTQKSGKGLSDDRRAALQSRMDRLPKNHPDRAKIMKQLGEEIDLFTVVVAKEGRTHHCAVIYEDQVVYQSKSMTESAASDYAQTFIEDTIMETYENILAEESAIQTAKDYARNK
jgi:hypothetical protein